MFALRGISYTHNTMPLLLVACKELFSGIHIPDNYACCQCCLLHDTMLQAAHHMPQIYFL
jgi:hypothetical protein